MGCLFETGGEKRFKSINDKGDEIRNIFLPISYDRMLIGTSLCQIPEIDFKLVNEGIARCSRDFFVCSENRSDIACLLSRIGECAEIISKNDLEEIVSSTKGDS
jgi:hypothetical protein